MNSWPLCLSFPGSVGDRPVPLGLAVTLLLLFSGPLWSCVDATGQPMSQRTWGRGTSQR